jgi:hypothetical protein
MAGGPPPTFEATAGGPPFPVAVPCPVFGPRLGRGSGRWGSVPLKPVCPLVSSGFAPGGSLCVSGDSQGPGGRHLAGRGPMDALGSLQATRRAVTALQGIFGC